MFVLFRSRQVLLLPGWKFNAGWGPKIRAIKPVTDINCGERGLPCSALQFARRQDSLPIAGVDLFAEGLFAQLEGFVCHVHRVQVLVIGKMSVYQT